MTVELRPRISGHLLARNAILNFTGQAIPILVALVAIPYIVRGLGVEKFAILSLAWSLIAYFSYLDLGVSRATIKFTAEAIGRGAIDEIPSTVWTSLALQGALGLAGALGLIAVTPALIEVFNIPPSLVEESHEMFYALAAALPVVLWLGSLKGVLEAAQRFDVVNLVRVFSNSLMFVAPAVGVALGYRLSQVIVLLVTILTATTVGYLLLSLRVFPVLRTRIVVSTSAMWPLLRYGRWVMISSALVPVIVYADRLFIAMAVSLAAVGFYAGAYEIASRLQVIPWSMVTTLFPAFSTVTAGARQDPRMLYARSLKYLLLVMGPLTILVAAFAREILTVWLGKEFAEMSTRVLQILAVGMLLNALSQVPASVLDGIGRPDLRAKALGAYLPPYLLLLWGLVDWMGITGAALAWMIRGVIELSIFFVVARRSLGLTHAMVIKYRLHRTAVAVALLGASTGVSVGLLTTAWWSRGAVVGLLFAAFAAAVWQYVLDDAERGERRGLLTSMKSVGS